MKELNARCRSNGMINVILYVNNYGNHIITYKFTQKKKKSIYVCNTLLGCSVINNVKQYL